MRRRARSLFAPLLLAACLAAAVLSVRRALAEFHFQRDTAAGVARALELAPGNARYRERWADFEPASAASSRVAALRLNPYLTHVRLEQGLANEFAGNTLAAERDLRAAYSYDRMFLSRWTLANFYFRRGDGVRFRIWARAAAEMAHDDLTPLFDLCWRMDSDAAAIAAEMIPPRPAVLRAYLSFLLARGRFEAAEAAFSRLAALRDTSDRTLLLAAVERIANADSGPRALRLWNQLAQQRAIPYPALDESAPIVNGDFSFPTLGAGFDWHPLWNPAAAVSRNRIEFSGRQPDEWETLWQPLVLTPGSLYEARCRYRTGNLPAHSGLRWRLLDRRGTREFAPPSDHLSDENGAEMIWRFQAPAANPVRLSLCYRREPGTARIEGTIELESIRVRRL